MRRYTLYATVQLLVATASLAATDKPDTSRHLDVAFAEIAAARACDLLSGQFQALRSRGEDKQERVTGTLWINECRAAQSGNELTIDLGGQGWRWIFRERETMGADFELSDHLRFRTDVKITGTLDIDYAPDTHVLTLWFRPESPPEVSFQPIGDLKVEEQGIVAEVLGAAASLFMQGPEDQASEQVSKEGREKMSARFEDGLTVTMDLCTGEARRYFGIAEAGKMIEKKPQPDLIEATLRSGTLLISGPYKVEQGQFKVEWETGRDAPVQARLMCQDQAGKLADAVISKRVMPDVESLAVSSISGIGTLTLRAGEVQCPVAAVTRTMGKPRNPVPVIYRVHSAAAPKPLADCR